MADEAPEAVQVDFVTLRGPGWAQPAELARVGRNELVYAVRGQLVVAGLGFRCCRALCCPPASPSCSLATTHPATSPRPPAWSTRRISALEAAGARGCEPMKLQQWLAPQAGGGGWKGAH